MTIEERYGEQLLGGFVVRVAPSEEPVTDFLPVGAVMRWPSAMPPRGYVRADGSWYRHEEVPHFAAAIGPPRLRVHGRLLPPWGNVVAWWRWRRGWVRVPDMRRMPMPPVEGPPYADEGDDGVTLPLVDR